MHLPQFQIIIMVRIFIGGVIRTFIRSAVDGDPILQARGRVCLARVTMLGKSRGMQVPEYLRTKMKALTGFYVLTTFSDYHRSDSKWSFVFAGSNTLTDPAECGLFYSDSNDNSTSYASKILGSRLSKN